MYYVYIYTVLYCIYTDIILIRSDWYCYWYCYIPKHAWLATWQEHAKGGPSGAGDNGDAVPLGWHGIERRATRGSLRRYCRTTWDT